ncbi:hypothetical protein WAI453_008927 [Rhynchosporium graminicola]|uniref:Uncharacterized protein n=1 Tax=Rhynchosporium graminicola TaxID=2792576 RepID=A0A1E1LPU3_9HELO|nr:uncharacterized protein RCO7_07678 [Rhynchosporium commune]
MAASPTAMPGTFDFHSRRATRDTAPPRLSGAKSHIFQPPRTPNGGASASSSLILTRSRSSTSIMSISSTREKLGPRKRTREDYHERSVETPRKGNNMDYGTEDWSAIDTGDDRDRRTPGSPKPFVNTRYQLAGGMDTPSLLASQRTEMRNQYGDEGYRKSLADTKRPSTRDLWGDQEQVDGGDYFGRECNGRGRYSSSFNQTQHSLGGGASGGEGWSKTAIQVAGAVVGKAWEFCKTGAAVFRGFQAGGGTRYQINLSGIDESFEPVGKNIWEEKNEYEDRELTPLPGQYPTELDFVHDYMDRPPPLPTSEYTPPRPSKRRQISANQIETAQEELAKNWVVVPPQTTNTSTPSKPPAPAPRYSRFSQQTTSSSSRRSVVNANTYNRPASRAGLGTPIVARRPALSTQTSRISHAGSPALNRSQGASYASPRSPANSGSKIPRATGSPLRPAYQHAQRIESPAAKEAKRWATMKKREEREADESIRRLDAQLKAMIKEGKEALGTKIEVDMEDDLDVGLGLGLGSPRSRSRLGNSNSSKKWAF